MKLSNDIKIKFMQEALFLAESVKGNTFPNPAVGAVLVKDKDIIGVGATSHYGGNHAEVNAISSAKDKALGATLFVSLEPCNHFGKTPPCTKAIVEAGIKKVFVAIEDPNPLVAGTGVKYLRDHGIEVEVGLLEKNAEEINEEFFFGIKNKMTWITVKLAMTLDGRISDNGYNSKWITGEGVRTKVHALRATHAAIAVGRNTVEKDDPRLDVRYVDGTSPIKIVFGNIEKLTDEKFVEKYRLFENLSSHKIIIVGFGGKKGEINQLDNGLEVWSLGADDKKTSIKLFREMAFQAGITSLLVEGGSALATSFVEHNQVNKLYLFYGNKILGGGVNAFEYNSPLKLSEAIILEDRKTEIFGDDIMVSGYPKEGY